MALAAGQSRVLAFQQIPRLFMIKGSGVPLDEREIFAIMLGVAAGALLARSGWNVVGGVQPSMRRDSRADFGVTTDALQRYLSAEFMATRAIGGSVQRLVWTGERSG